MTSPDTPAPVAHLVAAFAVTLERLTSWISRDPDADAGEGVPPADPWWEDVNRRLADYSANCAEILNLPQVTAAITEWQTDAASEDKVRRG